MKILDVLLLLLYYAWSIPDRSAFLLFSFLHLFLTCSSWLQRHHGYQVCTLCGLAISNLVACFLFYSFFPFPSLISLVRSLFPGLSLSSFGSYYFVTHMGAWLGYVVHGT
jgi:hypothetical protein